MLAARSKSEKNLWVRSKDSKKIAIACRFTLAALGFSLLCGSAAQAEVLVSRYAISLAGMYLGDAIVHTTLSAQHYKVAVSADVGVLFINRKLQGEVSGTRSGEKLAPEHFRMVMTGDEEDNAVDIRFSEKAVPVAKITPPPPARQVNNRVPLTEAHLKGVLDPLSALLAASLKSKAGSNNPCHDVLPVFTGFARIDVSLHPKPEGEESRETGMVTCDVHYAAIAGHPKSGGSEGLPRTMRLEIVLKRIAKPRLWLLENLSFPTPVGTVTVQRAETRISGNEAFKPSRGS